MGFVAQGAGLAGDRWEVLLNRVAGVASRVSNTDTQGGAAIAAEVGFEPTWSLRDRVVHRAIGLDGRTVFDMPTDGKLTMSELAGRSEVRALLMLLDTTPEQVVSEQKMAA